MTISMSLRRIKSLKGKMGELSARAAACVSFKSETPPVFDFDETLNALTGVREELVQLEASVARANATTTIDWAGRKMSLAEAIRRLQEFKGQIDWFSKLPIREGDEHSFENDYDDATGRSVRRKVTITWITKVSEKTRVQKVDQLKEDFEELNSLVESANHRTVVDWCK
jgi:hypothetical protein